MQKALRERPSRALAIAIACVAVVGCRVDNERLPPMPHGRRVPREPAFDPNRPFDFRLARVRPEAHLDTERLCDVVFAGAAVAVSRRSGGRYPIKPAARRLIRCGAPDADVAVDLVFPPDARSFVSAVEVGMRLRVKVIAADGGFEDATVVSFVAVLDGARDVATPRPPVAIIPIADDVERFARRRAPQKLRCAVAYARPLERIGQMRSHRFPRGATSHSVVACRGPRGDKWIDLVFTSRTAPQALALTVGRVVRLSRLHPRGGEGDVPFAILLDGP